MVRLAALVVFLVDAMVPVSLIINTLSIKLDPPVGLNSIVVPA